MKCRGCLVWLGVAFWSSNENRRQNGTLLRNQNETVIQPLLMAGGGSERFGSPKALHRWRGRPLIDHVLDVLRLVLTPREIWVGVPHLGSDMALFDHLSTAADIVFVEDDPRFRGPAACLAAGAASGLRSGVDWLIVCACDMPGIRIQLLAGLCNIAIAASEDVTAVVPRTYSGMRRRYEPLHALYRPAPTLLATEGVRWEGKLQAVVGSMGGAIVVDEPELHGIDPLWSASILNANTPKDLERLERLLDAQ